MHSVVNLSRRLIIKTSLENQNNCSVKTTRKKCLWFLRQPVIFKASLDNQKACLDNQKGYSVNCTRKFVFGFQDNLCSLGLIANQIELFVRMRF